MTHVARAQVTAGATETDLALPLHIPLSPQERTMSLWITAALFVVFWVILCPTVAIWARRGRHRRARVRALYPPRVHSSQGRS